MGGGGNMLYPGIPTCSTVLGYEISTEWCPTFNGAVMNDTMYTQYVYMIVDGVSKANLATSNPNNT